MKKAISWGMLVLTVALFVGPAIARAQTASDTSRRDRGRLLLEAFGGTSALVGEKPQVPVKPDVQKPVKKVVQKKESVFMRLKRDRKGEPISMQTSIVRYKPAKGDYFVDLVGVVHVGERGYYNQLNDRFEDYDVVLYELVANKGVIPRPGRSSNNPIAILQKIMTVVLQLEHQMNCVDYTPKNFVHADLSPAEMQKKMAERGDTPLTIGLSVVADILRQQNLAEMKRKKAGAPAQPDFDPLKLLSDPEAPSKIKRMMAEQMIQMGDGAGLGKTLDTILVKDRNAACMKVLTKQLLAGKKKVAIFYGAAHMPDFEQRLVRDFGMRRDSVHWYSAWDLRPRPINLFELLQQLSK